MDATAQEIGDTPLPKLEETDYPENAIRMLRAAVDLFARKGYKGTSVREIVEAAQVTNPMLYYYFDDKEGLFETLIEYLFEELTSGVAEAMGEAETIEQSIEHLFLGYFEACKRTPIAVRFVYTVLFGPTEGTPHFDIFEVREQLFQGIAAELERGMEEGTIPDDRFPPEFLAEQLLGLVNNHLMRALKEAEQADDFDEELRSRMTPEAAHDLRKFVLGGVRGVEMADRDS